MPERLKFYRRNRIKRLRSGIFYLPEKNCAKQREDTKTKYKRIWRPKESKLNTQRNKSFAGKQLIIFFYRGYIREKLLLQLRIHFTAGFYIVCNTDFVSDGK